MCQGMSPPHWTVRILVEHLRQSGGHRSSALWALTGNNRAKRRVLILHASTDDFEHSLGVQVRSILP